jgi:hypothetical protein
LRIRPDARLGIWLGSAVGVRSELGKRDGSELRGRRPYRRRFSYELASPGDGFEPNHTVAFGHTVVRQAGVTSQLRSSWQRRLRRLAEGSFIARNGMNECACLFE